MGALRAEGPWCAHRAFQRVSEAKNDREIENFRSVLLMSLSEKVRKSWCHRGGTVMKCTRDTVSRPRCRFPRMIYAINQPNLKG